MAQIKSIIPIRGRMDQDTDELSMRQGDHTYALNARFNKDLNAVLDALGTTQKGVAGLPVGAVSYYGALDAGENIFYAVGVGVDHYIMRFNVATSVHSVVVNESYLKFDNRVLFQYNEDNDTLYWTDGRFGSFQGDALSEIGYNPPRMVNVDKAVRFYSSGGTDPLGYSSMSIQHLDVIKYPASLPVTCRHVTEEERRGNLIRKKMLQFTVQYVYEDNTRSVWSIWSEVALPTISEGDEVFGDLVDHRISWFQNAVRVRINTGHETVKEINVAVRDGNNGVVGIFETVDKVELGLSDDAEYDVFYRGNEVLRQVSFDALYNYDLVPITANENVLVSGNVSGKSLVYGGIREGFPGVSVDVDVNLHAHLLYNGRPWDGIINTYFNWREAVQRRSLGGATTVLGFEELDVIPVEHCLYEGFALSIDMDFAGGGIEYFFFDIENRFDVALPAVDTTAGAANVFAHAVHAELLSRGYTGMTLVGDTIQFNLVPGANAWVGKMHTYNPIRRSIKKGDLHPVGIVYFDRGKRDGGVHRISEIDVPLDRGIYDDGLWTSANEDVRVSVSFDLNHQPPLYATNYAFVYQGAKTVGEFQRRVIMGMRFIGAQGDVVALYLENTHYLSNNEQEGQVASFPAHEPAVGDIVRIITNQEDYTSPYTKPDFAEKYIELEVIEVGYHPNFNAHWVKVLWDEYEDFTNAGDNEYDVENAGFLAEIITTKKSSDDSPYFTTGKVYGIGDKHLTTRYHEGEVLTDLLCQGISSSSSYIEVYGDYSWIPVATNVQITVTGSAGNNGTYTPAFITVTSGASVPVTRFTVSGLGADDILGNTARVTITCHQSLASGLPATCHLEGLDVYCRQIIQRFRVTTAPFASPADRDLNNWNKPYWIESFHYSDKYLSDSYSKGQPYVELGDEQGFRYNKGFLRNSLSYVEDALVNGLSTFLSPNQKSLTDVDGAITRMVQRGFTLRILQKDKSSSIYIEREEVALADGQNQLVTSNRVLGSIRPDIQPYGTVDPYSVVVVDGDVYFWDGLRKTIIKDTPGGQVNIGERQYGMESFLRSRGGAVVFGGHDRENNEVLFHFRPKSGDAYTLAFNYIDNVYTTFFSYRPELFVTANDDSLYTFASSQIHLMNSGLVRNYYGSVGNFELDMVMNERPDVKKVFDTHEMSASEIILVDPVTVPADAENANGMETKIPVALQSVNEGTIYGPYLRDMNSPGFGVGQENQAMYEGRPMRGLMVKHKYIKTGAAASQLKISYIVVWATPSEPL